jgi:hypothetical protein
MPNIYALLVGINNYPSKPLQGCINDVKAFKDYLLYCYHPSVVFIKTLTDEEQAKPTRQNLIEAFRFFEQAKENDSCLFYYSGHGSFSKAPEAFQTDNGFVQSFVCQDSRVPGGKDLMDKEMSFLIWKLMSMKPNVNFVAITDCCHSGTITKALIDDSGITDRMMTGQDGHVPAKPEEYLGYGVSVDGRKAYEEIVSGDLKIIKVRQEKHIHLAASKDNQTSKELTIDGQRRGAFTHSLLKTLYSCEGKISYKELIDKCSALVKNLVHDQQPDVNVNGELAASEKEKIFLSQESAVSSPQYLVYHDPKYSWCLKGGLVQGISKGDKIIIEGVCNSVVTESPSADISVIQSKPELGKPDKTYYAKIERQPNHELKVSFAPLIAGGIKNFIQAAQLLEPSPFISILPEGSGQYIVHSNIRNEAFITSPGSEIPVFKPLPVTDSASAKFFLERIDLISKWTHLLEFDNPSSSLTNKHYSIKLYRSVEPGAYNPDTFEEIKEIKAVNDFFYKQNNDTWYQAALRLSITNTGTAPLWVTNAYLGFDYGITTDFLATLEIGPGKEVWLNFIKNDLPDDVIKTKIDKKYQELGYNEITEYIKLFIATNKIDTNKLNQDGVDLPAIKTKDIDAAFSIKGLGGEDDTKSSPTSAWKTETIGLRIIKPQSESVVSAGTGVNLGPLKIIPHSELAASVSISSSAHTSKSADGVTPPHAAYNNSYLEPFDLTAGTRSGTAMDVLELFDVKDKSVVTADNPLIIQLEATRSAEEDTILPIGYDPETKLYYPLGYTSANGNIVIETLPSETESDAAITQRSFLGSIKIYFQKVIGQKLGFKYDYPRLSIVTVTDTLEVSYENDTDKVKAAIAAANDILLFVHGIIGDTEGMVKCIKSPLDEKGNILQKKYDLVLAFDYENLHTKIEENAQLLKNRLQEVGLKQSHGKQLTIVAHSMGGLVSRWFIEKTGGHQIVTKLIMLGTPNNGTPWADVRDLAETLVTYAINGAAFLKPWLFVLSAIGKLTKGTQITLQQMDSKTGIYSTLNDGTDPLIPYSIVAGNTQTIIVHYEKTSSLISKLFLRIKNRGIYDALDLVLFKKPNDIAVTSESITLIKGTDNWKHTPIVYEVASDHMNYFNTMASIEKIR